MRLAEQSFLEKLRMNAKAFERSEDSLISWVIVVVAAAMFVIIYVIFRGNCLKIILHYFDPKFVDALSIVLATLLLLQLLSLIVLLTRNRIIL